MIQKLLVAIFILGLSFNTLAEDNPQVRIVTNKGTIELELDAKSAPATVKNFLQYVDSGFYQGTVFHRVIKSFMIQGGGFDKDLNRKPTLDPVANEAFNGLKNDRGTIAMARTNMPHSATSQFFINTVDNNFLNYREKTMRGWGYTVFGKVTKGMEVVEAIENTSTGARGAFRQDVPVENIIIEKVEKIIPQ